MITNHASDSSTRSNARDGALLRPMNDKDDSKVRSEDIAKTRPRGRPRSPSFVKTKKDQHVRRDEKAPPRQRTPLRRRDPDIATSSGRNPVGGMKNKSPVRNKNIESVSRSEDQLSPLRPRKTEQTSPMKSRSANRRRMSSFQGIGIVNKKGNNLE